jgi:plastocyanin
MKDMIGIISFAILLSWILFFPLGFDFRDSFKLLQAEQEKIEILILSRSFTVGNPHYEPQNVTAKVGTLVVWINGDLVHHTVTSDAGIQGKLEGRIFDSGPIPPRTEFLLDTSRLLDDVYTYHCTIHPWVKGKLTLVTEPITVMTDKSLYSEGEKVTVSGISGIPSSVSEIPPTVPKKLTNVTAAKSVSLKIFDSKNELFLSKILPTVSGGKYSYTFTAGKSGTYTVKATINSFGASTAFQVVQTTEEKFAEKVIIGAIKFEDQRGMAVSAAKAGEQISIQTSIKNSLQTAQDYAYAVQVKDANEFTVLLTWKEGSIAPLGLSTSVVTWTPKVEGTYSVEVFVWKSMTAAEPLTTHIEKATLTVRK